MKSIYYSVSIAILFSGCGPVAYQPRPVVYNNMPAQQQIVQYNSNPFINSQQQAQTSTASINPEQNKITPITKNKKSNSVKQSAPQVELPNIKLGVSARNYVSQISGISYEQCGITPVMVTISNQSLQPVYVDITQFSALTSMGDVQPYMPIDVANIAMNSEGFNQALRGAGEGAVAGAAGGALIGGIAAVALGLKFEDGARYGAVSGGIGGIGGGAQAYKQQFAQALSSEIESKKFTSRNIYPNTTVSGVLFFPNGVNNLKLHLPTSTVDIQIQN